MTGPFPYVPGVPAAGHVTSRGYWHPGGIDGCPKCTPPTPPTAEELREQREWFARLSDPCPVEPGKRIRLIAMTEDPDPIPPGSEGTVRGGNGSQMWVEWDNGRSLHLSLPHDTYEVLS